MKEGASRESIVQELIQRGYEPAIPFTILAFFPAYQLQHVPSPTLAQMLEAYQAVREEGLLNVKLGNCGRFARTSEEFETLLAAVGPEAIA